MTSRILKAAFGVLAVAGCTFAAPDPNFHIYIAYGQSNMAGAGDIRDGIDNVEHPRYKMFATAICSGTFTPAGLGATQLNRSNLYAVYPAVPPMFHCAEGLGVADWFGRYMADSLPEVTIGVIPVAVGGSKIELFDKDKYEKYLSSEASYLVAWAQDYGADGNAHARIVETAKKAMEKGVIKGFIFHQGESGAMAGDDWQTEVKKTRDDILEALNLSADSIPFLAGEMEDDAAGGCCYSFAKTQVAGLPQKMSNTYVVKSTGLKGNGKDPYHFSSASYQEFGLRYAQMMLKHANVAPVDPVPSSPYKGSAIAIPGKVEMEDFDITGIGAGNVSYMENTSTNNGKTDYRSEPVDIYKNPAGGYSVGYTEVGEWLKYTVDVKKDGAYDLVMSVASGTDSSAFKLYIDDVAITDVVKVPQTGDDWSVYTELTAKTTELKSGKHTLKFEVVSPYVDIDYIEFKIDGESSSDTSDAIVQTLQKPMLYAGEYTVFDMQGKSVGTLYARSMKEATTEVRVAAKYRGLPKGVYYVRTDGGSLNIQKVVIR